MRQRQFSVSILVIGFTLACGAAMLDHMAAQFDTPALSVISDEDRIMVQQIRNEIDNNFSSFQSVNQVNGFLDKVKLLVQKHPKNVAFASGDLKDLHSFLSQDLVTRLIRLDSAPFELLYNDESIAIAQKFIDMDELARQLFSGPLKTHVEAARRQVSRIENGSRREVT